MSILRNLQKTCFKTHCKRSSLLKTVGCFHQDISKRNHEEVANTDKTDTDERNACSFRPLMPIPGRRIYKVLEDDDTTDIFDVEAEKQRFMSQDEPEYIDNTFADLNLKRGLHGVYDIEDLVEVLRKENAEDIFVCSVPKNLKYVDYLVICSGRNHRHITAIVEFVHRVFKMKRAKGDIVPKIEGKSSRNWLAIDLGNIALHIFEPKLREKYDLESLWALGSEYDKEYNKPEDPIVELLESHSVLFADVKPAKH